MLSLAYALLRREAVINDRLLMEHGAEPRFVEELEYGLGVAYIELEEDEPEVQTNIVELAAFVERANTAMGGKG